MIRYSDEIKIACHQITVQSMQIWIIYDENLEHYPVAINHKYPYSFS